MVDIRMCKSCYEDFHMDDGSECAICGIHQCESCTIQNGASFHDLEGSWLHICKNCLNVYKENGIKYIQSEINGVVTKDIMDAVVFEFEEWLK